MNPAKHILLICFTFPPNPGIGGRRWAKFAKFLSQENFTIHTITSPHSGDQISKWTDTIDNNPAILRYEVPDGYPVWQPSQQIWGKIRNRFTYWRLLASTQGTPYDRSIFWHAGVHKKAVELIRQHQISTVILTGPPFHHFYHLGKLKDQFPHIKLILDFRDPWTTGTTYGMTDISSKRLMYEQSIEKEALRRADVIIGPYELPLMLGDAMEISGSEATIQVLPHAFDPEDIDKIRQLAIKTNKKVRLIYGGSLYPGTEPYLKRLARVLSNIRDHDPSRFQNWEFVFYTPETHLASYFSGLPDSLVQFHPPVSHHEILTQVRQSDICMLFLNEEKKHFKTTKFAEFSALERPFLLLGPDGQVAQFIEEQRIGRAISNLEFNRQTLIDIIGSLQQAQAFRPDFQYQAFSYPAVTQKLIQLFDVEQPSQQTQEIHV